MSITKEEGENKINLKTKYLRLETTLSLFEKRMSMEPNSFTPMYKKLEEKYKKFLENEIKEIIQYGCKNNTNTEEYDEIKITHLLYSSFLRLQPSSLEEDYNMVNNYYKNFITEKLNKFVNLD